MRGWIWGMLVMLTFTVTAQEVSDYIVVDQFGYLPGSRKIAVIRNPQVGFDQEESFTPGSWYGLVNATTGEKIYRGEPVPWKDGQIHEGSGDRAWLFDFSGVGTVGTFYIVDEARKVRSHSFVIAHNVYNEVLRQAMRTFFYQRVGYPKEEPYAEGAWADGPSHLGELQDLNCRSFFDKENPATERDVSGGWYDAGDYNKYTNWTANYVVELMKAYLEKPGAWSDDYGIPESGNGVPDILDEAIWGIDHLLRMQMEGGGVLSIVGEDHASPPSSASGPSYYGPPNTSATLNTSAAFALASGVYHDRGMTGYADTLLNRAVLAWEWAKSHPDSLFNNNDPSYNSQSLGAGRQEVDDYGRAMARLEAACYLFGKTGEAEYRVFFDDHYQEAHMFQWNFVYPYEALNQEMLLYYTTLPGATVSVRDHIRSVYLNAMKNNTDNLPAFNGKADPYQAHLGSYVWGSNGVKSSQGSMFYNLITFGIEPGLDQTARDAAGGYIHYIHGTNPLNFVYLSNMYAYGAENGVNEFYHSWFTDGSPLWDRVGSSIYGPPPGYLTGGANPGYDWDGCCPSGCGSYSNNQKCLGESISPPKDQPPQKSYKDFNTSWPINSWEVTENSCGYQVRYIRLLSKFVSVRMDCNGEVDGGAFIDSCGVCAGGNTGITPSLDPDACFLHGEDPEGDTMYVEGRHLYTASGEKVVLRGVNEMFVWSDDRSGERLLPEIAKTGANCVRLVWIEEVGDKQVLAELIDNCVGQHMIAMPECHSATGEWENLDICIRFWKDAELLDAIQRNRRWTLLNIGNEVGDHSVTGEQFSEGYKRAIDSLRAWGYTVPLVIDASGWGQDVDMIFGTWEEIQEHDPLHNILFSVHSYWGDTRNYQRVANESVNSGLPVIIGEGPSPTRYPTCELLDYGTGLEVCGRNEIGWLPWSWGGIAGGHCVPNFDLALDGVFGDWVTPHSADMMVGHPYSLMRTAERPPSFFENDTVPPAGIIFIPSLDQLTVGDTLVPEVIVSPANAWSGAYVIRVKDEDQVVSWEPERGTLVAEKAGTFVLEVYSEADTLVSYSRSMEVLAIPVSQITVVPSAADLLVGDTLMIEVDILPENATNREVYYRIDDPGSAIRFDSTLGQVIAIGPGEAEIEVIWANGPVSAGIDIQVSELLGTRSAPVSFHLKLYPNPNNGVLHVSAAESLQFMMEIRDLSGRVVFETFHRGPISVDISGLSPGTYTVSHRSGEEIQQHKLIML